MATCGRKCNYTHIVLGQTCLENDGGNSQSNGLVSGNGGSLPELGIPHTDKDQCLCSEEVVSCTLTNPQMLGHRRI